MLDYYKEKVEQKKQIIEAIEESLGKIFINTAENNPTGSEALLATKKIVSRMELMAEIQRELEFNELQLEKEQIKLAAHQSAVAEHGEDASNEIN